MARMPRSGGWMKLVEANSSKLMPSNRARLLPADNQRNPSGVWPIPVTVLLGSPSSDNHDNGNHDASLVTANPGMPTPTSNAVRKPTAQRVRIKQLGTPEF